MVTKHDLSTPLRRYWGYDSFRPLQERIVASLLAGHDACVVMPTGGGKSLCYQLPAAILQDKTVIVISPLIALMQDQMAQLQQMGISAGVLNSALPAAEQSKMIERASQGKFRLLYLSPERLARADTLAWLKRVPISFFAIDEAHCISEWGHEFRPEYRQLNSLRQNLPDKPIAAFTASATRRVRHDIIEQLRLREPDKYIASFHRPNLRYVLKECEAGTQDALLVRALQKYAGSNVIVYAPTINRVEETVDFLEEQGISAIAYHGKMDSEARRRNQERWTSDEVRVLVGTIAFGLGINKASVRAVIHLSLPKSIEQYYQEAGRAGRDGKPADCILLWQNRDVGLLTYFVEQISDPVERERAWQRYREVRHFVETPNCRHLQVCLHFGEKPKWKSCGACDVCGFMPDWLSIAPARKAKRAKVMAAAAAAVASAANTFSSSGPSTQPLPNSELSEYLREWRRTTAREQGVAAFVVMHDTALEELCRVRPNTLSEIRRIPGFGERKTALYGQQIVDALHRFQNGARASQAPNKTLKPAEETMQLLAKGRTLEEIAKLRGRQLANIVSMVAEMVERQEVDFNPQWMSDDHRQKIEAACATLGIERLTPIKSALPPEISFDEIKLVVAKLRADSARQAQNPRAAAASHQAGGSKPLH